MVVGKIVTKIIQTLPSWEVTKYYGRVCIFQLRCLKYRIQTSEAWFNFKCKFMPNSLRNELECQESVQEERKPATKNKKKEKKQTVSKASDLKIDPMEEESDDSRDSRSSSQDNISQFYNDDNPDHKSSKMLRDKEQNEYYIKDFREENRKQKSAKSQKKARQQSQ